MFILRRAEERMFGAVKAANKAAKKVWEKDMARKWAPISSSKDINAGVKSFRSSNSPMSMTNGSYAKDMNLDKVGKLNRRISTRDTNHLREMSGKKTNNAYKNWRTGDNTIYGGGYQ